MSEMFRAEVTDGVLQFTVLHVSALKIFAFLPIELDEERSSALRTVARESPSDATAVRATAQGYQDWARVFLSTKNCEVRMAVTRPVIAF